MTQITLPPLLTWVLNQERIITDPKTFNDFDDYDNYTTVDSTMPSAVFNIFCTVVYVE